MPKNIAWFDGENKDICLKSSSFLHKTVHNQQTKMHFAYKMAHDTTKWSSPYG